MAADLLTPASPAQPGLSRFARMLQPGSKLSVEVHGSASRPRYSAALAGVIVGMSMQAGAQQLADQSARLPEAVAVMATAHAHSHTFSAADSIVTRSSRARLDEYGVLHRRPGIKVDGHLLESSAAVYSEVDVVYLGGGEGVRLACNLVLIKQANGDLIPDDAIPMVKLSGLDREMLNRLIFYHEDSHCDAYPWTLSKDEGVRTGGKADFHASTKVLESRLAAISARFNHAVPETLKAKSEERFARDLAAERYADTRAALHLAQYMLVQRGFAFEDFARVMGHFLELRQRENAAQASFNVMNDHDTLPLLQEVVRVVHRAHEAGAGGVQELFGAAASAQASPEQLARWNDRSAELARTLTRASMDLQGDELLSAYAERSTIQVNLTNGTHIATEPVEAEPGAPLPNRAGEALRRRIDREFSFTAPPAAEQFAQAPAERTR